jgi:predicted RNA-binding protein YlqC (UPF0109 family)
VKDLVTLIAKALVDHPDSVDVKQVDGERSVIMEVRVHPDDVGKVIGRNGRIVEAIRTIVKASAAKQQKKASVEIVQ